RRLQHRAFAEVDDSVARPLAEADDRRCGLIPRPAQAEARPASARRHGAQRVDDRRIDPDPLQRGAEACELGGAVGLGVEMLQDAAATAGEMAAYGVGAAGAPLQPFDGAGLASALAAGAEPGLYAVARQRERHEDGLAAPMRDAVAPAAERFDRKVGYRVHVIRRVLDIPG